MSSEIKRFDVEAQDDCGCIEIPHEHGDYVYYSDHWAVVRSMTEAHIKRDRACMALEQENASLRASLEDALQFVETLHSTVAGESRQIVGRCLKRGRAAMGEGK